MSILQIRATATAKASDRVELNDFHANVEYENARDIGVIGRSDDGISSFVRRRRRCSNPIDGSCYLLHTPLYNGSEIRGRLDRATGRDERGERKRKRLDRSRGISQAVDLQETRVRRPTQESWNDDRQIVHRSSLRHAFTRPRNPRRAT